MDCLWGTVRKGLPKTQWYGSFRESNLWDRYPHKQQLLEANLVEFEEGVVPAHHPPNGPLVGLQKSARCWFGDVHFIRRVLVGADHTNIPDGPTSHIDLRDLHAVAYAWGVGRVVEPGQSSHIQHVVKIVGSDVGGPLDGVNFGGAPSSDERIVHEDAESE